MLICDKFYTVNIREYLALGDDPEAEELAWLVIEEAQYMFGGMVTFLEAENEGKLLSFYYDNRFSQFDTRQTEPGTDEPHELVQLLRLL